MTAISNHYASEFWKRDSEFDTIEVSNTGRVRNARTKVELPLHGSGGKAFVQVVDKHGRRHDRNVRRLVRKLFGTTPIRIVSPVAQFLDALASDTPAKETPVATTDSRPETGWVPLVHPGVREGHQIHPSGRILSTRGEPLNGSVQASPFGNYVVMSLQRAPGHDFQGDYIKVRLDELVARHFVGSPPSEEHVAGHRNGDTMDNSAENLEWVPRVHRRIKRSPVSAPVKARRVSRAHERQARRLNADPDWRAVINPKIAPGCFWVSRDGRFRGLTGKDLATSTHPNDPRVYVSAKSPAGVGTTFPLDRLVLEAFSGDRPTPQHRVLHRDDNPANCALDNLYWGIPGKDEPGPTPVPKPVTRTTVTVTVIASYRCGDVEVIVNPDGTTEVRGDAVKNAREVGAVYTQIAEDGLNEIFAKIHRRSNSVK